MPLRVQLAENRKTKVVVSKSVVMVEDYPNLVKLVSQKLQFKAQKIRFFITKKNNGCKYWRRNKITRSF